MGTKVRVTSRGILQEKLSTELQPADIFSVEIPYRNIGNEVVWAPFMTAAEAADKGYYVEWSDAVAAVNALQTEETFLLIEADPWHHEVIIPGGTWTLKNTTIVGKVAYAQGGRNWYASNDAWDQGLNNGWQYYNQQYRGHQIKLWVHPEDNEYNPTYIKGCVGLKDMFWRGTDFSYLEGYNATISDFVSDGNGSGTAILTDTSSDYVFSEVGDVGTDLQLDTDEEGWWNVRVIEVIDAHTVRIETMGNGSFLTTDGYNGEMYWYGSDRRNSTFNLRGRLGGKESYFANYDSELGWSQLVKGYNNGGPSSSDNNFNSYLVGAKINVSNTDDGNGTYDGDYTIMRVDDSNTVWIDLNADLTGTDGDSYRRIRWTTIDHTEQFTLDNVDFRSPYGDYGSLNLMWGNMFLNLTGKEVSVRNGSVSTDGFLVVQSDGSPAWIGGYAIYSYNDDGYLKIYAQPGMSLNTDWINGNANISFDIYQGNVPYIYNNSLNWNSTPYNVKNALDELAARVRYLENL